MIGGTGYDHGETVRLTKTHGMATTNLRYVLPNPILTIKKETSARFRYDVPLGVRVNISLLQLSHIVGQKVDTMRIDTPQVGCN